MLLITLFILSYSHVHKESATCIRLQKHLTSTEIYLIRLALEVTCQEILFIFPSHKRILSTFPYQYFRT